MSPPQHNKRVSYNNNIIEVRSGRESGTTEFRRTNGAGVGGCAMQGLRMLMVSANDAKLLAKSPHETGANLRFAIQIRIARVRQIIDAI